MPDHYLGARHPTFVGRKPPVTKTKQDRERGGRGPMRLRKDRRTKAVLLDILDLPSLQEIRENPGDAGRQVTETALLGHAAKALKLGKPVVTAAKAAMNKALASQTGMFAGLGGMIFDRTTKRAQKAIKNLATGKSKANDASNRTIKNLSKIQDDKPGKISKHTIVPDKEVDDVAMSLVEKGQDVKTKVGGRMSSAKPILASVENRVAKNARPGRDAQHETLQMRRKDNIAIRETTKGGGTMKDNEIASRLVGGKAVSPKTAQGIEKGLDKKRKALLELLKGGK